MTRNQDSEEQKDVITHEIYFSFYQGRDITQPQGSIPPGNLITKHEDATRKRGKIKKKQNEPALLYSLRQSTKTQPALCSPCNYTQPVECCPGNAVSKSLEN